MKSPYISELQPNQTIKECSWFVQGRAPEEIRRALSVADSSDRSGELDAKMWDNAAEAIGTFERDDLCVSRACCRYSRIARSLRCTRSSQCRNRKSILADYLPASKRDRDEMFRELQGWIAGMSNPHLKRS